MPPKCAFGTKFNGWTCFTDEKLRAIVEAYVRYSGDESLQGVPLKGQHERLLEKMKISDGDERKLLRADFMMSVKEVDKELYYDIMLGTFAPKAPHCCEPYHDSASCCPWLSNFDIMRVMYQFQRAHPRFLFLDAPSSDFRDHDVYHMSRRYFHFSDIRARYDQFAAIINLDLRNEGGSHWVTLFCDIPKRAIYFFDSTGSSPYYRKHRVPYIVVFMLEIASLMTGRDYSRVDLRNKVERGIDGHRDEHVSILINRFGHQQGNTECGVYAIHTIEQLLAGKDFVSLCQHKIPDYVMSTNRTRYFTNSA